MPPPIHDNARIPGATNSKAYRVVGASFFIQAAIVGAVFSYGVFFDALHAEFGWSRAIISGAASLTSLIMGVWAMVLGRLSDRIGPRLILLCAGASISFGYFLMSMISAPWQLYLVYALFVGAAFGSHDVLTLSTVARWFDLGLGKMSGIVKTGTSTGQILVPPTVALLIATFGWRSAFVWLAAGTGPLVMIAASFMRTPSTSEAHRHTVTVAEVSRENTDAALVAIRTPAFRWTAAAQLAVLFCMSIVIVHIVPYGTDMGLSRRMAAGVLSTIGATGVVGRLTVGGIIDRVGARRGLQICYVIMLIAFVILQFASSSLMLYAFALVCGFAHGGAFTGIAPLVAEFFGTRAHGQLFGTVVFVGTIAAALAPVIAGTTFDMVGTYRPVFLVLALLLVFAVYAMSRLAKYDPQRSTKLRDVEY